MSGQYEFDKNSFSFKKVSTSLWGAVKAILKYMIVTISIAVCYYIIFTLFISTDEERRLRKENKMYEKMYPELVEKESLLGDVVEGLQLRDKEIYERIFQASVPAVDPINTVDFLSGSDSIPDKGLVIYTEIKAASLEKIADKVEENFRKVYEKLSMQDRIIPPVCIPLERLSYAQVGATVGKKINPFYKVEVMHNGVDLLANQEEPVVASADGIVTEVIHSKKCFGNMVAISHKGGYVTQYAHLSGIFVSKGQFVKRGRRIGSVGITGNSFAPHLHYEILKDGVYHNPVNYFLAGVDPDDYANMLFMSVKTGQSMD